MTNVLPRIFKGIALFTPGGDLIYGIDPDKQAQWHNDLCLGLQKIWGLADSPHFLVPGYTATVERWLNPQTQEVETIAEAYPAVERYIPLLQLLFNLEATTKWEIAPWREEQCSRAIIETYKPHFPQLWSCQDLIVRLDPKHTAQNLENSDRNTSNFSNSVDLLSASGELTSTYVLRLFISSDDTNAEETLSSIHQLLEESLGSPYTLKVIDLKKSPQQADIHKIAVTPTLVRLSPEPVRRIVGQLDDIQRVLRILTSFE